MLTMNEDDDTVLSAIRAGASGYLLKGSSAAEVQNAVRAAAGGGMVFGAALAGRVATYFASARPGAQVEEPFPDLSERERTVLDLLAAGKSNDAIARELFVSGKTVRNAVSSIYTKLHAAGRGEAIVKAREAGYGKDAVALLEQVVDRVAAVVGAEPAGDVRRGVPPGEGEPRAAAAGAAHAEVGVVDLEAEGPGDLAVQEQVVAGDLRGEVGAVQLRSEELRDRAVLVDELAVEGREPARARVQADGRERRRPPALGAEDRRVEQPDRPRHGRPPARVVGVAGRPVGLHRDRVGHPAEVRSGDAEVQVPAAAGGDPGEPVREVLAGGQPDQLVTEVAVGQRVLGAGRPGFVDRRRVGEQLDQGVAVVEGDVHGRLRERRQPGLVARTCRTVVACFPWAAYAGHRSATGWSRPRAPSATTVSTVSAANGLAHE